MSVMLDLFVRLRAIHGENNIEIAKTAKIGKIAETVDLLLATKYLLSGYKGCVRLVRHFRLISKVLFLPGQALIFALCLQPARNPEAWFA
jgi:hypothetical protein